jgi:hypothetical protein
MPNTTYNREGSPMVDPEPITAVLRARIARYGLQAAADDAGLDPSAIRRLMAKKYASLDQLDYYACQLDRPDLIHTHYANVPARPDR